MTDGFFLTASEAYSRLPQTADPLRFVELIKRKGVSIEYYSPQGVDVQTPHDRDEIYVIVAGKGIFMNGNAAQPFGVGDLLFVPANQNHRFVEFTPDLQAWVVFF